MSSERSIGDTDTSYAHEHPIIPVCSGDDGADAAVVYELAQSSVSKMEDHTRDSTTASNENNNSSNNNDNSVGSGSRVTASAISHEHAPHDGEEDALLYRTAQTGEQVDSIHMDENDTIIAGQPDYAAVCHEVNDIIAYVDQNRNHNRTRTPTESANVSNLETTAAARSLAGHPHEPNPADDQGVGDEDGDDEEGSRCTMTMKDLFGVDFELNTDLAASLRDPALVDTRRILLSLFGACVQEQDVWTGGEDAERLREAMQAMQNVRHRIAVEQLFGSAGAAVLRKESVEAFNLLRASVPTAALDAASALQDASCEEKWLVEMPKVVPNRQVLHADPQPYFPSRCAQLESHTRMLYTPSNVMRWAYQKAQNLYMSNTRLVRWSDGSVTLHVGSDMHDLAPSQTRAVYHMLGNTTTVRRGELSLPAVVAMARTHQHFVVEPSRAASIERAIMEEGQQHRAVAMKLQLPYLTSAMPAIDWTNLKKAKTPFEEYVAHEYERREKEMERRMKEGRPMSIAEQIAMEQEMLAHLRSSSAEELRDERVDQEAERAAYDSLQDSSAASRQPPPQQQQQPISSYAPHALRRQAGGAKQAPRSRLDRDLGLTDDRASLYDLANSQATHLLGDLEGDDDPGDSEQGDESNDSGEEDPRNEYEVMLEAMRRKRARDDTEHGDGFHDENGRSGNTSNARDDNDTKHKVDNCNEDADSSDQRHNRLARREDEQRRRFATLITALQELTTRLPADSDAYGSANGTLDFLRGGSFAAGIVQKEIPLMLREIADELPLLDTSGVLSAFNNIFPA